MPAGSQGAFVDPEILAGLSDRNRYPAIIYPSKPSYDRRQWLESQYFHYTEWAGFVASAITTTEVSDAYTFNRELATGLCEAHPDISTDPGIFGGNPHIKNVRLTVGNILAKLYVYGNIKEVADMYAPHVSEDQIKEAIAYAQDFLDEALHANESP